MSRYSELWLENFSRINIDGKHLIDCIIAGHPNILDKRISDR